MALDPVLQQMLDQMPEIPQGEPDVTALRNMAQGLIDMLYLPDGPIPVAGIEDFQIDSPDGPIPARIYRPSGIPQGTLLYCYGGGWCLGNIDIVDQIARRLARDLSMVIVTFNYRLAPEDPFPAAFNDCTAAARWVLGHIEELGGLERPAVLTGESAGGNLAAAVAMALRDEGAPRNFDVQLLYFPAVDLRDTAANNPSRRADADPSLKNDALPFLYRNYSDGHDLADPRISPAAAKNFADLPPAVVIVLTIDPLRDEAVAYAEALENAGVRVELVEFDNLVHGFTSFTDLVPAAAHANAAVLDRLHIVLAEVARAS